MPSPSAQEDDDYDSAADSDFQASEAQSYGEGSEDSDADAAGDKSKLHVDRDLEMGSGDEGIVAEGKKKKRKKKTKGKKKQTGDQDEEAGQGEESEEDEAGVGIRVRLRSGRGGEETKNPKAHKASAVTANIEDIWTRMNDPFRQTTQLSAPPAVPAKEPSIIQNPPPATEATAPAPISISDDVSLSSPGAPEATITIPHTYNFAGQIHTSTKTVPISSPAAQAHLTSNRAAASTSKDQPSAESAPPPVGLNESTSGASLRRPLARRNLFEPNPTHYLVSRNQVLPARTDLPTSIGGSSIFLATDKEIAAPFPFMSKRPLGAIERPAEKLNTVEKSKLDWEAEVQRLGIREELEKAGKSAGNYLARREFLDRVEMAGEERARGARLAGT